MNKDFAAVSKAHYATGPTTCKFLSPFSLQMTTESNSSTAAGISETFTVKAGLAQMLKVNLKSPY